MTTDRNERLAVATRLGVSAGGGILLIVSGVVLYTAVSKGAGLLIIAVGVLSAIAPVMVARTIQRAGWAEGRTVTDER